jgi:hypothetical protein
MTFMSPELKQNSRRPLYGMLFKASQVPLPQDTPGKGERVMQGVSPQHATKQTRGVS